jgi:AMP-activated protein kinase-like protein
MNETEKKQLLDLLGADYSVKEIEKILAEDPRLAEASGKLQNIFFQASREGVPRLSPEFTARVMEKIQGSSLGVSWLEKIFRFRSLAIASACAATFLVGLYFGPRFFPTSPYPGLSVREEIGPDQEKIYYVRFALKQPRAEAVSVAGDFNQWNPVALRKGGDGTFSIELPLNEGTYSYAFVIDGKKWIADASADRIVEDGFGNSNSLINL